MEQVAEILLNDGLDVVKAQPPLLLGHQLYIQIDVVVGSLLQLEDHAFDKVVAEGALYLGLAILLDLLETLIPDYLVTELDFHALVRTGGLPLDVVLRHHNVTVDAGTT